MSTIYVGIIKYKKNTRSQIKIYLYTYESLSEAKVIQVNPNTSKIAINQVSQENIRSLNH